MNTLPPHHSHTATEELEEAAKVTAYGVAAAPRVIEVVAAVLLALLVCPPLLIVTVVVVVPLIATALLVSLVVAVFATPYLIVRHIRGHRGGHLALLARLRHALHALVELLPHRIFARSA